MTFGLCAIVSVLAACPAVPPGEGPWDDGVGGAGAGSGSVGSGGFHACATATHEAEFVPVNMYFLLDKSGSMQSGQKWLIAREAVQSFFASPSSAGLGIALRFFPDGECGDACDVNACASPNVPLGELTQLSAPNDAQEEALLAAFAGVSPGGVTPMSAALAGAYQWAENVVAKRPDEKTIVLLVTDGKPEACNTDPEAITDAGSDAFTEHGIVTYAIGMQGAELSFLMDLASKSGSDTPIDVTLGADNLVQALADVRKRAFACEYQLPVDVDGQPLDPSLVNVLHTQGGKTDPLTVEQVPNVNACHSQVGGWYYDDPVHPTRILLCSSTCEDVQSDDGAKIDILLGCKTVIA